MADKFKCPFCGEELERCSYLSKGITNPVFVCGNKKCKFAADKVIDSEIWQTLIESKKAQDALKVARSLYQELALAYCEMVDDYSTTYGCLKTPEQEAQEYMQEYDEKIASITKQ